MLPKNKRVTKEVIGVVLKKSKSFYSENITLRVSENTNKAEITKFSFVVSLKVSNKAVKRNLLKRRASFIVSKINKQIKNGFLCVFIMKPSVMGISYNKMEKEIFYLCKKANIIL